MDLRDVTEADLPILFEHQREPAANRMAAFPARDWGAFLAHWRTRVLGGADTRSKAVVVGGEVAGYVGSWQQQGERLVGYWIGQAYWGQGVATGALGGFLSVHERTRPIHAYVAVANVGSIRVLEKSGFRRTGDPVRGPDGVEELRMGLA